MLDTERANSDIKCGKKSLFGSELPCPSDSEAVEPDEEWRSALVEICGEEFQQGPVCCNQDQIENLKTNLKKAENIIGSCPACKQNFFALFCRFTCSPDQSTFLNVTKTAKSMSGKDIVTELDYFVDPGRAEVFYNSCREVKFSATNGYAMDLIGGGAKDYKSFLKFLGDEKPLLGGSPFQMNFPWDDTPDVISRQNGHVYQCFDDEYKCACADCSISCPELDPVKAPKGCKVGILPCLSFAVVIVYLSVFACTLFGYMIYRVWLGRSSVALLEDDSRLDTYSDNGSQSGFRFFRETDRPGSPYKLNSIIQVWFAKLGLFCAKYPRVVISTCAIIVILMSSGMVNLVLEKEPAKLWVSSESPEAQEKAFFDENFGPFYRTQQAYLISDEAEVLTYDNIKWWFGIENHISNELEGLTGNSSVRLSDICLKPTGDACVVQSFTQYFGGNIALLPERSWKQKLDGCAKSPVNCLPPFQLPLKSNVIFGGYENDDILTSKALVITWVVNNDLDKESSQIENSLVWENSLEGYLLEVQEAARSRGLRLSFSTESSLEKELNKSSNTDANIIILSYIAMFIYASFSLGGVLPGLSKSSLVNTKFSLGLFGILVVLISVTSSVGLFATIGIKATLIIAEVIPFLVLAVGVDNIFLMTHELESVKVSHPNLSVEQRVSRAIGRIGPSILLSSSCETLAFALGASVSMPAVRNFAIYSAGAVCINSMLQLTMFVSALALDQKRVDDDRVDCFPFLKVQRSIAVRESYSVFTAQLLNNGPNSSALFEKTAELTFTRLIRKYYSPYLFRANVKKAVLAFFVVCTSISIALLPKIELGLDQRLAVPADSYLVNYFNDLYSYLNTGPPVYFVVPGDHSDATQRHDQQQLCGRFAACQEYSLVNVIEQERKRPDKSFIVDPAASWIDDFLQWLNPDLEECCRFKKNTNETEMCGPTASPRQCEICYADKPWDTMMSGFPEDEEFMKYFKFWIESPSDPCPLGGKAPYGSAISWDDNSIKASHFRSSHTPLRSQKDFIESYAAARRISKEIGKLDGVSVFPYSPHYVFFAQYHSIIRDSMSLIGGAIAAVCLLTMVVLGSIRTALVVAVSVILIVVNVAGLGALCGVGLNAVSLVNLVICVGLGVEFCIHVARAYTFSATMSNRPSALGVTQTDRAMTALASVGGSVFGGIAMTKLIGVCVLAFTKSRIFDVYYFRMWACLVLVATSVSLCFLPVALSICGGGGYIVEAGDPSIADDLASRVIEGEYRDLED